MLSQSLFSITMTKTVCMLVSGLLRAWNKGATRIAEHSAARGTAKGPGRTVLRFKRSKGFIRHTQNLLYTLVMTGAGKAAFKDCFRSDSLWGTWRLPGMG